MKKFIQILGLFVVTTIQAQQNYSSKWEDFYSYNNVKDFVISNQIVFAIVDNAVFKYNISSGKVSKISSVNGLSGETATSIYYNENLDKIVIGYQTGLLEIIDNQNEVTAAKDIVNFNYSGNKTINNITSFNNKLYLATSFAIIVYDLDNLQFGDTYFIGNQSAEIKINEIKIFQDTIYAATENGIFIADINNSALIDFNNWAQNFSGNFSGITIFNDKIFTSKGNNLYKIENNNLTLVKTYASTIKTLKSSINYLTIATSKNIYINNGSNIQIATYTPNSSSTYNYNLNTAFFDDTNLYLGTKEYGILKSNLTDISSFEEIHPEGPTSNAPFSITVNNNNLWVVYGGYESAYGPLGKRFGFSHFNGTSWINKPYNTTIGVRDLVHVTIDPSHENKAYISSWGGGMLIVENDSITTHWNHLNSGLERLDFPSNPNYTSIRINGSSFDNQGNLWIANAWVDNRIKKYSANGTWSSFDMSSVITNEALGLNELIVDKTNTIWIGSRRNGVLVFNENGNKKLSLTSELTKGSLPDLNARTVQADASNRIWIGTKKGLVVLFNGASIFNEVTYDAQPIIIVDDGIPKKLLGNQPINSIAIDGADNKWFGTDISGATQTNSDGSVILHNFNKDNSPLPSNTILKIAVDKSSGKVYFATDKGIVAYNSKVSVYGDTMPEVYAYPNPSTKNNEFITIDGRNGTHIPNNTNVKILDAAGNLVYETNVKEGQELFGGKVVWDKTNLAGKKVASGIYIVLLFNADSQENAIAKIAIIN
jgi:sugar lactone lactonase YvrE